jgi:hypothetical protein
MKSSNPSRSHNPLFENRQERLQKGCTVFSFNGVFLHHFFMWNQFISNHHNYTFEVVSPETIEPGLGGLRNGFK